MNPRIMADAPLPPGICAFTTLRHGAGTSVAPFDSFNLGNFRSADGDDPEVVARNRAELVALFGLPSLPHWLKQVHGTRVLRFEAPAMPPPQPSPVNGGGGEAVSDGGGGKAERVERPSPQACPASGRGGKTGTATAFPPLPLAGEGWGEGAFDQEAEADAAVTSTPGVVLAILTADCLPVVFAAKDGSELAAAHAGWPGLSKGMLEATLAAMRTPAADIVAWIGPAAGPMRYEVGDEVRAVFVAHDADAAVAFKPTKPGHWLADLPAIARMRLTAAGMQADAIHGGDHCTISDPARYFSHRRDGRSGRIATLAWMQ